MLDELRDDFDRWWLTATFQEKASLGVSLSLIVLTAMSMFMSLLRGPRT